MSKPTDGEWGARSYGIPDRPSRGWIVVTPPAEFLEDYLDRAEKGENLPPFTSKLIGLFEESHYTPLEECEANAKLCAAAKKLKAACEEAYTEIGRENPDVSHIQAVLKEALARVGSV